MESKTFDNRKVTIRKLSKGDLKKTKEFRNFINSLIKEDAQLLFTKEFSLKEEKAWLVDAINGMRKHKKVLLVAENSNGEIVGTTEISQRIGRQNHIGEFGITIKEDYRRIGLGKYLTIEIVRLAKKELKPKPKIIRLSVLHTNKSAINLYGKCGFKEASRVPKQLQYKGKLVDEIIMLLYL